MLYEENEKSVYPEAAIWFTQNHQQVWFELFDAVEAQLKPAKLRRQRAASSTDDCRDRQGIFFKMQQLVPEKNWLSTNVVLVQRVVAAHTVLGQWTALKRLKTHLSMVVKQHEIFVSDELRVKSLIPLNRMLDFAEQV